MIQTLPIWLGVVMFSIMFLSQANAQNQPPAVSPSIPRQYTQVNGTYTNSAYGVQITLPNGWSGYETTHYSSVTGNPISTSVVVAPGGIQSLKGEYPSSMMTITMAPKGTKYFPQLHPPHVPKNETCTRESIGNYTNADYVKLSEVVVNCSGSLSLEAKYDVAQTNTSYIIVSYVANSANYESQLATYKSSLDTLWIPKAIAAPVVPEFPLAIPILVIGISSLVVFTRLKRLA